MPRPNPQVDAYIANAAPFARPILVKLRKVFHKGSPKLEEKIKWGCPSFEYKGMVCGFAAFKKHVSWGFWKASLLKDPGGAMERDASSPFSGGRPTDVSQLPAERVLIDLVRQAVELNEKGVKNPKRAAQKNPPPRIPTDLAAALRKHAKAKRTYQNLSASHKREYVQWITEAKTDATRRRRLDQTMVWLAEGKPRNWKYMKQR